MSKGVRSGTRGVKNQKRQDVTTIGFTEEGSKSYKPKNKNYLINMQTKKECTHLWYYNIFDFAAKI